MQNKNLKLVRKRIDIDHARDLKILNDSLRVLNNCVNHPQKITAVSYDLGTGTTKYETYGEFFDVERILDSVNELIQKIAFQSKNHCIIVEFVNRHPKIVVGMWIPRTPDMEEKMFDQLEILRFRSKYHQKIYLKKYDNFEEIRLAIGPERFNKLLKGE